MQINYYASILAGDLDSPDLRVEEPDAPVTDLLGGSPKTPRTPPPVVVDPMEAALEISVLDSRKPLIPYNDYYNEPLCDCVEMDKDFTNFKSETIVSVNQ